MIPIIANSDGMTSCMKTTLSAGERWHKKLELLPTTAAQRTLGVCDVSMAPCLFNVELGEVA
jgi:hypothetical protein